MERILKIQKILIFKKYFETLRDKCLVSFLFLLSPLLPILLCACPGKEESLHSISQALDFPSLLGALFLQARERTETA